MVKKIFTYIFLLLLVPAITVAGTIFFGENMYMWIALCAAVLSCIPFFLSFEKSEAPAIKTVTIAVMVAVSVISRIIFAPTPGFKPVTAITVFTAMYFGKEAGFMTGALSALVSNMFFGQGMWTPFQMIIWGLIGFVGGILASPLKRSKILLAGYGLISGIAFSLLFDFFWTLSSDMGLNISRYIGYVINSFPFMCIYAVSNIVFLLILSLSAGKMMERIKIKFNI